MDEESKPLTRMQKWTYNALKVILPVTGAGGLLLAMGPVVYGWESEALYGWMSDDVGTDNKSTTIPGEVSVEDIITVKLLNDEGIENKDCVYIKARKTPDGLYTSLSHQVKPCDSLDEKL